MQRSRFALFAWAVLCYNLVVVLWGALVRATGSGAGCGDHWPLCNGATPTSAAGAHWIELTHRSSVGVGVVLVVILLVWAAATYPRGHQVRLGAALAFLFTFSESLIGAGLVLYKLVEHNDSAYRAIAISAHLTNTFLLLASFAATAAWASGAPRLRLRGQGDLTWVLGLALCGAILLGISGAVTALGDTLYPAHSLADALREDISPTAHVLIRLRLLHPLIAVSVGLYLLLNAGLTSHLRPSAATRFYARGLGALFAIQMLLGLVNVGMKAPIWMQLVHLLAADLVWLDLVLLALAALGEGVPHVEMETAGAAAAPTLEPVGFGAAGGMRVGAPAALAVGPGAATWRDYLALTKPRVISLLLFTTLTAMFIAGRPGLGLFIAVAIGGYMAAGAANAVNMVIDRDIDMRMKRTENRPTVTRRIPSRSALRFAFVLGAGSFLILWAAANLLTGVLAMSGLAFYVLVYTMALKRRTWHNIVIGGAAGAFPPLVGWAAVTGTLSPLAWYLFAIIFVWTPVHFWALALLIRDDYAAAGIPMLPVVHGVRVTVIQIALYAVLTATISALPIVQRQVGYVYLVAAVVLNAALLLRSFQLYQRPDRPHAASLFKYSMVYLALLFLVMAVDRSLIVHI